MRPIVGIDPSLTATGLAVWSEKTEAIHVTTVNSSAKDGGGAAPQRQRLIAGAVFAWLALYVESPAIVVMEGLTPSAVGNVTDLAGLRAVLAYGLVARGHILVDHKRKPPKKKGGKEVASVDPSGRGISPSSVKLFALGKGSGAGTDKDAMILAAQKRLPEVPFANNNEADALWLMGMGAWYYAPEPGEWPARNLTALDTIDWPEL